MIMLDCEQLSLGFAHSVFPNVDQTGIAGDKDGLLGAETRTMIAKRKSMNSNSNKERK